MGIVAIFLPWTTVGSDCANTAVMRAFAETTDPIEWSWLYVLAFTAVLGSTMVRGSPGAWLAWAGAALAVVANGAMLADLLAPFEAMVPRAGLSPVRVLCQLEPTSGAWLAMLAWILAVIVAWRRAGPRLGWASRRLAGALATGLFTVWLSFPWVVLLVDVVLDTTSIRASDAVVGALGAMTILSAWVAWRAVGGRPMVARSLLVIGGFAAGGPLILLLLRLAHVARANAAILADWNEPNGLIGPILLGATALWGVVLLVAGALVARRRAPSS